MGLSCEQIVQSGGQENVEVKYLPTSFQTQLSLTVKNQIVGSLCWGKFYISTSTSARKNKNSFYWITTFLVNLGHVELKT